MSYTAMRPDGVAVSPASRATVQDRMSFIRKVYGLVFLGILFFAAVVALPIAGAATGVPVLSEIFALSMQVPWFVALIGIIVSSIVVHKVSMVPGVNLLAFFAFSALWGILSIPLVAIAINATGSVGIVFQALGLTCLVFGGLTVFVFITRKDFSFMGGFLAIGTFVALGGIVLMMVLPMFIPQLAGQMTLFHTGLSIMIVLLFSGYVLYDTSKVMNHYATDMVVPAALALMVDFIILFRELLFLLMVSRD